MKGIVCHRSPDGKRISIVGATWDFNPEVSVEDFKEEFDRNYKRAAADYASVPMITKGETYFKNPMVLYENANLQKQWPIINIEPWHPFITRQPMEGMDFLGPISDKQFVKVIIECNKIMWQPWFVGEGWATYEYHVDLAKNRCSAGFAVAHWDGARQKVVVDLALEILPQQGKDIYFRAIEQMLILGIINRNFRPGVVSFDIYQSVSLVQGLQDKGIDADYVSFDSSCEAYDTFFQLVGENKVEYPAHPHMIKEFQNLILRTSGKGVDHPGGGTKDVSDAVSIVVHRAYTNPKMAVSKVQTESENAFFKRSGAFSRGREVALR